LNDFAFTRWKGVLLPPANCMHKCIKNRIVQIACTNGLPDDEHMMFET